MKKILASILVLVLMLSIMPMSAFADNEGPAEIPEVQASEAPAEAVNEAPAEAVNEAPAEAVNETLAEELAEPEMTNIVPEAPVAPEAPIAPEQPEVEGLSAEDANQKITAYNEEIDRYNEAVEKYNEDLETYKNSAADYNKQVESYNEQAENHNRQAEEHNKAEQEKLDAYNAELEKYNQSVETYNKYEAAIARTAQAHSEKIQSQMEALGDIARADKESILNLGTVLEEDYTVNYGRFTNTLGKAGDLVISWNDLAPTSTRSTIQVEAGADSDVRYKVANLHIFEDFQDFSEMADYQSQNGWDCMNINVDDTNGVIIIPKALIDRIAMIEIEVAEVGANDTVTVSGQNSVFQGTYATVASRFLEGYTAGAYWYTSGTVFQSNAATSDTDWTGTSHTFSFADGTCDYSSIKNPLNVNHYVFQKYNNPYTVIDKPEEYVADMMERTESKSLIEIVGESLKALSRLSLIKTAPVPETIQEPEKNEEIPTTETFIPETFVPEAPVVPAAPVAETAAEQIETIPAQPVPLAHFTPSVEIIENETPLANVQSSSWALVNLLACVLTVLLALAMRIGKRRGDDDEANTKRSFCLPAIVLAAASVVLFLITENMRNPMALVDAWTPVMLILLAANGMTLLVRRPKESVHEAV